MSYEPTTWKKGDKVTSTKLNKIEQGIQGNDIELANIAEDVTELKSGLSKMQTATAEDVGKALKAKTVTDGKVKEWEFGEAGGVDPEEIEQAVSDWLDEHPEATTTVPDWSLTENKLVKGALGFVTPEMFGAVGDGVTDDTASIRTALEYAIAHGCELHFAEKTYIVTPQYLSQDYCTYSGERHCFLINKNETVVIDMNGATIKVGQNSNNFFTVFFGFWADGITIKNGTIVGDLNNESYGTGSYYDSAKLVDFHDCLNVHLIDMEFKESKGDAIGFNGLEITQTYQGIEFRDVYMNSTVENCVIHHVRRNGVTITKGRGINFYNCLMETIGPASPGAGVDIEPYYGNGSVFDIRFDSCIIRDVIAGGIFIQNSDNIWVTNSDISGNDVDGIMCREAYDFHLINNKLGAVSVKTGTGEIIDNRIIVSGIEYAPRANIAATPEYKSIIIRGNTIEKGGIQIHYANTNPLILDRLEIKDNYIANYYRHAIDIGNANTKVNFKNVIIDNNIIERYSDQSGGYQHIIVHGAEYLEITGNKMATDADRVNATVMVLDGLTGGKVVIANNIWNRKNYRYSAEIYKSEFYPLFLSLLDCTGINLFVSGNLFNPNHNKGYERRNKFINYNNALTDCNITILNNYAYELADFVTPNTAITLCKGNILNDEDFVYIQPSE